MNKKTLFPGLCVKGNIGVVWHIVAGTLLLLRGGVMVKYTSPTVLYVALCTRERESEREREKHISLPASTEAPVKQHGAPPAHRTLHMQGHPYLL